MIFYEKLMLGNWSPRLTTLDRPEAGPFIRAVQEVKQEHRHLDLFSIAAIYGTKEEPPSAGSAPAPPPAPTDPNPDAGGAAAEVPVPEDDEPWGDPAPFRSVRAEFVDPR